MQEDPWAATSAEIEQRLRNGRGEFLADHSARLDAGRWPHWLRWWHDRAAEPGTPLLDDALRWLSLGATLDDPCARQLDRCARLIAHALRGDPAPEPATCAAGRLEGWLLLEACARWQPDPDRSGEQAGLGEVACAVLMATPRGGRGVVAELVMRRLPPLADPQGPLLVRAPASLLVHGDAAWQDMVQRVSGIVRREVADPDVASRLALTWDLRPMPGAARLDRVDTVEGGSAGALFALAALALVRGELGGHPSRRGRLALIDWRRLAVSASWDAEARHLQWVDHLGAKTTAWHEHLDRLGLERSPVLAAATQADARPEHRCHDLAQLITRAVELTSGHLSDAQAALHALLMQAPHVGDEQRSLVQVVAAERDQVRCLVGYLLFAWAQSAARRSSTLEPDGGQLDRRFVKLYLRSDQGAGSEGERFPRIGEARDSLQELLRAEEGGPGTPGPASAADLVWLLAAEPGAGKSSLLSHLRMEQARGALLDLSRGLPPRAFCVEFDSAGMAGAIGQGAAWLRQQWAALWRHLPALDAWVAKYQPRLVVDALNQATSRDDAQRADAVNALLGGWRELGGHLPPLLSVRTLERFTFGAGWSVRAITLERWDSAQMRDYCALRLGMDNALWRQIQASDEPLRELLSLPFHLAGQCSLLAADPGRPPARDRAELMGSLLWMALAREVADGGSLRASPLLDDDERTLLQRQPLPPDRAQALALLTESPLVRGLAGSALALQHGATAGARHVSTMPAQLRRSSGLPAEQQATWLVAVMALGLVEQHGLRQVRFSHQSWQEYLAARALVVAAADGSPPVLPPMPPLLLPPLDEVLAELALKDSLPPPPPSTWLEVAQIGVQLDAEPRRWVAHLLACGDLALAGRAAAACRDELPDALLDDIRTRLLAVMQDREADVRLRVQAGEVLGRVGDPRFRSLQPPSGKPCIVPLEEHWVHIPAGLHTIGSDKGRENERPVVRDLLLPAFDIMRWPVTNAMVAAFIADGGYADARWWPEGPARAWQQGHRADEEGKQQWRDLLTSVRPDLERDPHALDQRFGSRWVETTLRPMLAMNGTEVEAQLGRWFPNEVPDEPAYWRDPDFNQPSQPVVGICLHEAAALGAWLADRLAQCIGLPTEAQVEACARLPWRWHDEWPHEQRQNIDSTRLGATAAVGCFPAGDLSNGLADMLGNSATWCASVYHGRLARDRLCAGPELPGPETPPGARWVVRGGNWGYPAAIARPSSRNHGAPGFRNRGLGVRLVRRPMN